MRKAGSEEGRKEGSRKEGRKPHVSDSGYE
jgi:hypothetical protein